jgi:hypothetical protein
VSTIACFIACRGLISRHCLSLFYPLLLSLLPRPCWHSPDVRPTISDRHRLLRFQEECRSGRGGRLIGYV